jgi:hypothetical protein
VKPTLTDINERIELIDQVKSQTDVSQDFILISLDKVTGNVRITNTAFTSFEYMVGLLMRAVMQFTAFAQTGGPKK